MPTIRDVLVNMLSRDPGVVAIIGTAGNVIAPVRAKQRSLYPNITYQRTSGREYGDLSGLSGTSEIVFEVNCWSDKTEIQAAQLAQAAKAALDRKRGYYGFQVQYSRVADITDRPVDPFAGDDVGLYCESLEVSIVYEG